MPDPDNIDEINPTQISLARGEIGYNVFIGDEYVGAIEGIPGSLEYMTVEMHWEGKGVARAALNKFIDLSRAEGKSEIRTNNTTHPAMEHILKTEGFEQLNEEIGWVKDI